MEGKLPALPGAPPYWHYPTVEQHRAGMLCHHPHAALAMQRHNVLSNLKRRHAQLPVANCPSNKKKQQPLQRCCRSTSRSPDGLGSACRPGCN